MTVIADRRERMTGRELVIPGLRADPNIMPRSPSPYDDEFDGPLGGQWTIVGQNSPTVNANDTVPSCLYLRNPGGTLEANQLAGVYMKAPSPPYTVTTRQEAFTINLGTNGVFQAPHLGLAVTTPGRIVTLQIPDQQNGATMGCTCPQVNWWDSPTVFGISGEIYRGIETPGYGHVIPSYARWVVAAHNSVTAQFSFDGWTWVTIPTVTNYDPAMAGGIIGSIWIGVDQGRSNVPVEMVVDWIRFTQP
jgi:hypothetical protein